MSPRPGMTDAPTPYYVLGSMDLGLCEVCEERPATQRARSPP
jgi:hypothetical protein